LQLLKLTSEEFSSTKEDLPADRKNELKTLLTDNLQPILGNNPLLIVIPLRSSSSSFHPSIYLLFLFLYHISISSVVSPSLDQLSQLLERAIQIISIGSPAKSRPTELDPQTNALCQVVFGTYFHFPHHFPPLFLYLYLFSFVLVLVLVLVHVHVHVLVLVHVVLFSFSFSFTSDFLSSRNVTSIILLDPFGSVFVISFNRSDLSIRHVQRRDIHLSLFLH
jgi:hypothetical protein